MTRTLGLSLHNAHKINSQNWAGVAKRVSSILISKTNKILQISNRQRPSSTTTLSRHPVSIISQADSRIDRFTTRQYGGQGTTSYAAHAQVHPQPSSRPQANGRVSLPAHQFNSCNSRRFEDMKELSIGIGIQMLIVVLQ